MYADVLALFQKIPDNPGLSRARAFFSPARINLIGEHIDYCGGLVLPAAIDAGTWFVAAPAATGRVRAWSCNQADAVSFSPEDGTLAQVDGWGRYVAAVYQTWLLHGYQPVALDIALGGNIHGSGLSSSASLGVGLALAIQTLSPGIPELAADQLALMAQEAENRFVGVNCGIMDQGSVALGRSDHAMLMNCETLSVDYIPLRTGDYQLLIADTCKNRQLVESAYNDRRRETDEALRQLGAFGIEHLCQLPAARLQEALDLLNDDTLRRRTRHVVTEHQRVIHAAAALRAGDLQTFGQLLNESHRSLQQDYEVTGPELDTLIGLCQQQPGVAGARMMGGGFGGCGLVLVRQADTESLIREVSQEYNRAIGYDPAFYTTRISDGAREISLPQ
ncbi:MAG: galactokinase [Pseudomonadales bacterium]|nr:galactokinase [Pseudomonadales bacterium]